jgi:hypothetical protein
MFCEGNRRIGERLRDLDPNRIYDLLKAAHCPQEDHHIVAEALKQRRPGSIDLRLTEEQYNKLKERTMMPIDREELLDFWKNIEDIPACAVGMEYAKAFLEVAGECVDELGRSQPVVMRSALANAYDLMAKHRRECDSCNEG